MSVSKPEFSKSVHLIDLSTFLIVRGERTTWNVIGPRYIVHSKIGIFPLEIYRISSSLCVLLYISWLAMHITFTLHVLCHMEMWWRLSGAISSLGSRCLYSNIIFLYLKNDRVYILLNFAESRRKRRPFWTLGQLFPTLSCGNPVTLSSLFSRFIYSSIIFAYL